MTLVKGVDLEGLIGNIILSSLHPSKTVTFIWNDDTGSLLKGILLQRYIPYRIYSNDNSLTFVHHPLNVVKDWNFMDKNDKRIFESMVLDLNSKDDCLIIDTSTLNDRLKPKYTFTNRYIAPFAHLYRSEIAEISGAEPVINADEFILREDDRNGIVTGPTPPPQHKEWIRYSSEQKTTIAAWWSWNQQNKQPARHALSERPKGLVQ